MILHLVTDRSRLSDQATFLERRRCLLLQVQHAVDARVDYVQIRERDLEALDLARLTTDAVGLTRGTRTRVLVNERLDVALSCGADGVHLRADSVAVRAARAITPGGFLIGRSVHSELEAAAASDADYLIAGTVWPSDSKPEGHPVLGLDGFAAIARAVTVPVLAIGGVTIDRVRDVAAAGGAGIAAIGLFIAGPGMPGCRALAVTQIADAARARFDTPGSPS